MAQQLSIPRLGILLLLIITVLGPSEGLHAKPSNTALLANAVLLYDFETGTEGWASQPGAIFKAEQSNGQIKSGHRSLKLNVSLKSPSPKSGNVQVTLKSPMNLSGKTLSAWVYMPPGVRGDAKQPNGLHLFVVDSRGRKLYGTWRSFTEGGWSQITLSVMKTQPVCGSIDAGFDPTSVRKIGLNIAMPPQSAAIFGGYLYLDQIEVGTIANPNSTFFYDFGNPSAANRYPAWGTVPGWDAQALSSPTVRNGVLSAAANFTMASDAARKGALGITYSPPLDLSHKDNTIISADVRFDPSAMASKNNCPFVASILAYDDHKKKWFTSDDIYVGTSDWTRIHFDINDMTQYQPGVMEYPTDTPTLDAIRQIVFQFWANTPFQGQLQMNRIAIGGIEVPHANRINGFVRAENGKFMVNDQRFRFVGANAEYLFGERISTVAKVLDQASSLGMNVMRTWGFSEGCEESIPDGCAAWSRRFQPLRGQWNEAAFKHFDQIVAMAAERGIRLIIPLANNWHEYGGRAQYIDWLKEEHSEDIPAGLDQDARTDLFYTNPHVRQWYKDYVTYFLGRTNSITGVRYSEDPTILAWELINEPRAPSDKTGQTLHQWIVEMSNFVRSLDTNHVIGTGQEGWYIMPKGRADARAQLADGTLWQNLPNNYWLYGVNWKRGAEPPWGSNGVDFISDHSSQDTNVCWQDYAGASVQTPQQCQMRKGVPNIGFTSMHLYIDPGATNIYLAPYCSHHFDPKICNNAYDRTYHQAFLWIQEHVKDAKALGKPFVVGEFGFRIAGTTGTGGSSAGASEPSGSSSTSGGRSGGSTAPNWPPFGPLDRAYLFKWYLEEMFRQGVDGVLFWNLGFAGFSESAWDDAERPKTSETSRWQYDTQSDATHLAFCPGPTYVTRGSYSLCTSYEPGKGHGRVIVNRIAISDAEGDWSKPHLRRFRVDIYSSAPALASVRLIVGDRQTWYESLPQSVTAGWNTITVDLADPMWMSSSTTPHYNMSVDDKDRRVIRQVNIGLAGYTAPGILYIDNLRHVGDDGLALYRGDPALTAIHQAACETWQICLSATTYSK
jgi:hypothetical protein